MFYVEPPPHPAVFAVGGGVAGAIAGSFFATLIVRWPAGEGLGGRSRCDGCGRTIGPAALVPLLSYLILRGRCRQCGARIDPRHPITEAAAAAIGAAAMWMAPGWDGAAGALFGWLILTLAILDLEHFWLPDRLTAVLAAAGVTAGLFGIPPSLASRAIGGAVGFAALAAIGMVYARLRGRVGLGSGDPKLLGAIGLWLGWQALPLVLFGASLTGLGAVAVLRLAGRRVATDDRLPLGTLMAAASWLLWCAAASGIVTMAD
jgi:leader peptidase (prepilin peptidase)/N-methyltransferase